MVSFQRRQSLLLCILVATIFCFSCQLVLPFQPPSQLRQFHDVSSTHKIQSLTRQSPNKVISSALFVSSAPSNTGNKNTRVVYQKVVRSRTDASGNGNPFFLGQLVEYLQDRFELPERLPMVYETVPVANAEDKGEKCIQSWDSKMSPAAAATRLDLEVVAIYTDDDNNKLPSMAMVVVRKDNQKLAAGSMPSPMMQNFFDDSERLILKALDRGLDDFVAGKISFEETNNQNTDTEKLSMEAAQEAMIEEMLEDAVEHHPSVPRQQEEPLQPTSKINGNSNNKNKVVDADFSKVLDEVPSNKKTPVKKSSSSQTKPSQQLPENGSKDFAVEAAKRAAKMRQQKSKQIESEDFAVAAAKKIGKQQTKTTQKGSKTRAVSADIETSSEKAKASTNARQEKGAFRTTFSTPEKFKAKLKREQKAGAKTKVSSENKQQQVIGGTSPKAATPSRESKSQSTQMKARKELKQKTGIPAVEGDKPQSKKFTPMSKEQQPTSTKRKTKQKSDGSKKAKAAPSDEEIMKTAQQVMAEMADQSQDMSAEELLQDVLKFGEKQDEENKVGSGFVTGAFDKAKELLREQKRQRDERTKGQVAERVARDVASQSTPTMDSTPTDSGPQVKSRVVTSEEEQLKRMFEAGERIADGRISLATEDRSTGMATNGNSMTDDDQKEVDELIGSDKSVSDHARLLDEELAELEVRIKQSPGEEVDGPSGGQNPLFDVFSGPEVYNPNVDPENAVNWPGALPGTKTSIASTLPKELNEAVKQASFAAEVLQKLEVRDLPDSEGKAYFVGDREMSDQQVMSLQTVVQEAVEIGIIRNPLVLMEERSRLQMVLDELWDQPEERIREIVSNYKELLLSDNFADLIKERLQEMADRDLESLRQRTDDDEKDLKLEKAHARERELLGRLVVDAQLLLKEARALGAELEAQQLEVIRSICKVAMDPSHTTEEETAAALSDTVRDMRPLFDDMFVSYLKYAVAEEEGRLARAGVLDDPEHNQWLFVLKIVQQGVYAEISKGLNRYVEHIWYVLRMETPVERKMLLEKLIHVMPTLDVRPFVRVVDNIVGSLGEAARGDFDGAYELGKMTNKLLQLHRDMKELLPQERIDEMSRDADEWAAKRKERMLVQRNLTKKRLNAARETEEYDAEVESIGRRGEVDRFT